MMGVGLGQIKTSQLGVRCLTLGEDWSFKIRINIEKAAKIDRDDLFNLVRNVCLMV